jgi:hypothetical protein
MIWGILWITYDYLLELTAASFTVLPTITKRTVQDVEGHNRGRQEPAV